MTKDEADQRLRLSNTVLLGWETLGLPGGRLEDSLRMIREETQVLYDLSQAHPHLVEEALAIGRRYQLIVERLRRAMS
jgi:hypothetical protein